MTILIEAEAKEIAELLTLLFTAQERLKDEKRNKAMQEFFAKTKEIAANETAERGESLESV